MPDSSADRAATLANVRPRDACRLLALVHDAKLRERSFIAARYADSGMHFEETLGFLEELGWIHADSGTVKLASKVPAGIIAAQGAHRALLFAEAVLEAAGPYRHLFARYLSQFERSDGELTHRPSVEARLRDASVRDFFMDLGAVTHRLDGDFFVLESPFAPCALWARNVLSPGLGQLARHAEDRLTLGYQAELAVVDWERDRLQHAHDDRVRHVAADNPASCYDIQSITILGGDALPRFIEVKAVSPASFEFHWSRAEIEAAEILGNRYFLHLVPVIGTSAFDLARMEIIQDAYAEVYRNPSKWSTTLADIVCRKRESSAS